MQHDGIIDGIISRAEAAATTLEASGSDLIIAVIAAYHREEFAQGKSTIKAIDHLTEAVDKLTVALSNGNGNSQPRGVKGRIKSTAPPLLTGAGLITIIVAVLNALT